MSPGRNFDYYHLSHCPILSHLIVGSAVAETLQQSIPIQSKGVKITMQLYL